MTQQSIRNYTAMAGVFSVLSLLLIFSQPGADPGDSPKAFAHGVGFVLPCIFVAGLFAAIGTFVLIRMILRFSWNSLKHPISIVSVLLLLPGLLLFVPATILFVSLFVSASHSPHFSTPHQPPH